MRIRPLFLSVVLSAGLVPSPPAQAGPPDLRVAAGLRIRYDDNVFQYSDRNLGRFDPALGKFSTLDSTDDVIVTPSVDVRAIWNGRYSTRVFAGIDLNQYTKNTDRSSAAYTVGLAQRVTRRSELTLRYRFVPTHLGWRLASPPNQPPPSSTWTYANAELSSSDWRLAVDHDLTRSLSAEVYGGWETKDYNAAFDHRDITVKEVGVSGTARWKRVARVTLDLARETGDASGAGDAALNSDTSYRQWSVRVKPTVSPTRDWDAALTYEYQRRDFTSGLAADRDHYQREDTTHSLGIETTVQVTNAMNLRGDYDRIRRTSNQNGADLDFGNYTEQRVTAAAEYRF